jgi:hypothetical protein
MAMLGRSGELVLDTLLPSGADPLLARGFRDIEFEPLYREFATSAPAAIQTAFRISLVAATWVAPLLIGKLPPLGRHRREVRERALEAMATSRWPVLRQLVTLQKVVVALAYGADPQVRERVGHGRGAPT